MTLARWMMVLGLCGLPWWAVASEVGYASYYGGSNGFDGRRTASGEIFHSSWFTCAHRRARFGTQIHVTNLANGRSGSCRVNDRGPFVRGRIIDLSRGLARSLGIDGVGRVRLDY